MSDSASLLADSDGEAFRLRGILGIGADWLGRWDTLSHGERKRVQVATCLWLRPDLLAVDEPTNHLDADAREMIFRALRTYRGIGLLVSHERDLLDGLCTHSLVVSPPRVFLRAGGYTAAMDAIRAEERAAREERRKIREMRQRLEREMTERHAHTQKAERAKSLRGVAPRDHDARERARAARDRDHGSGKSLRQLEGRVRQAEERESSLITTRRRDLGIPFSTRPSDRNAVIRLAAGRLSLGPTRHLAFPDLLVLPQDRVAVTGPNGSGKSTLLRHVLTVSEISPELVLYIPQEVSAEESASLLRQVKLLPRADLGTAMQWVSRLGSDPERILESQVPSPGEVRKLLLAVRLIDRPHLIVMDEPTNHMDLPSIECLEEALRRTECALLLASHDSHLLEALTTIEWHIAPDASEPTTVTLTPRALRPRSIASSDWAL